MRKLWNHYSYAIILIFLSFAAAFILSIRFDAFHQKRYVEVTVSAGDSLWKIADQYSEKQNLSNQEFVKWVQIHNNINQDQIFPGEKIVIPVSSGTKPINEYASALRD